QQGCPYHPSVLNGCEGLCAHRPFSPTRSTDPALTPCCTLSFDHREPFGLLLLVPEHQLGNGIVEVLRARQERDVVQRLYLPRGLDDHCAVAEHSAPEGTLVGQIRDLGDRHHQHLGGEHTVCQNEPLVGDNQPLHPPLHDLVGEPQYDQ